MTKKKCTCHAACRGVDIGIFIDGHEMTGTECRDLLNELLDENEKLNSEVKRLSHEQMCDADLIQQLRNSLYIDPYKEFIKYRNNFAEVCEELAEVNKKYGNLERENKQLKQQVEDLEFKLRTTKAYDRTKEEYSDSVYDFQKKIESRMTDCEEKSCGYCKHFQLDGMFGIWCDKGRDYKNIDANNCSDYERGK